MGQNCTDRSQFFCFADEDTLKALIDCLGGAPDSLRCPPVTMDRGKVTAEEIELAEYRSVADGLLLWAVAHSVFCMKPAKKSIVLLQFVQHTCLAVREQQSASCRKAGRRLAAYLNVI